MIGLVKELVWLLNAARNAPASLVLEPCDDEPDA